MSDSKKKGRTSPSAALSFGPCFPKPPALFLLCSAPLRKAPLKGESLARRERRRMSGHHSNRKAAKIHRRFVIETRRKKEQREPEKIDLLLLLLLLLLRSFFGRHRKRKKSKNPSLSPSLALLSPPGASPSRRACQARPVSYRGRSKRPPPRPSVGIGQALR